MPQLVAPWRTTPDTTWIVKHIDNDGRLSSTLCMGFSFKSPENGAMYYEADCEKPHDMVLRVFNGRTWDTYDKRSNA